MIADWYHAVFDFSEGLLGDNVFGLLLGWSLFLGSISGVIGFFGFVTASVVAFTKR